MGPTPDVVLLDFKPAAKQFVTAVTEKQADIELFAFLHPIQYVAGVVIDGRIFQIHSVKDAKLREAEAAFFNFDAIQKFAAFHADPSREQRVSRLFLSFKLNFSDMDLGASVDSGKQIEFDFASLRLLLYGAHFGRHVRIPLAELISPEALAEVLHPNSRIRFIWIGGLHLCRSGLTLIKELLPHRVDNRLDALLHANTNANRPGFIVLRELADLCFGLLIALAFEDISQTGKTMA